MTFFILLIAFQFQNTAGYPSTNRSEYLIRHYTIDDGLPVNSINSIVQDDLGYLYFSSYDGLVRYDGYEFVTYNSGNSEGMLTNRLAGGLKAGNSTLWLLNENGTVTSKTGNVFKTYTGLVLPGFAIRIFYSESGVLWIAGTEGVAFYDTVKEAFIKKEHSLLESETGNIGEGLYGEIYVVNESGLISIKGQNITQILTLEDSPIPKEGVTNVKQYDDRYIWVLGDNGAFRYNLVEKIFDVKLISDEEDLFLWNMSTWSDDEYIFTGNTGFYVFNKKTETSRKLPLPINSDRLRFDLVFKGLHGEDILIGDDEVVIDEATVLTAKNIKTGFLDTEGSIWIGTESNGLYQLRAGNFSNLSEENAPGFTNVYSIIEDKEGSFWACSFSGGIFRFSKNGYTNWNTSNSRLITNLCKFLYEDVDGSILAGLNNEGIWKFENNDWVQLDTYKIAGYPTPEVMHRKGKQLFIGNYSSLVTTEGDELRFFDPAQPKELDGVQVIKENSRGELYVGTSAAGVTKITGKNFINYSANNGKLNSNAIRDIYLQSDDSLWVVTANLGLNRLVLDIHGEVLSSISITTNEGLTQNSLHRMIDDENGNFWISGNGGIMRVSKTNLNNFADGLVQGLQVISYDENDGMLNREANGGVQSAGILSSDKKLWFPTQKGISIIDPYSLESSQSVKTPLPILESFEISDQKTFIEGKSKITLPKGERSVRINFTAPSFTNQERTQFSYKLEAVNSSWQKADLTRQAVFTNIPPGEHEFTLTAQRIGSDPIQEVVLISIPFLFYETVLFKIILVLLGSGLLFVAYKQRVRRLEEREKKLKHLVNEQTQELQEAAEQKQRFFTGITHELKTPLSLIVGPLDDISENPENVSPRLLKNRLSMMQRNSHRLQHLVNQILDVSKLNADAIKLTLHPVDLAEITKQIAGQFQSQLDQEEITLSVISDDIEEPIYVDQEAWERIVINLLTNAIKFSPKQSTITVEIINKKEHVQLSIKDEGPGIKEEEQGKVFEYLYQVEGAKAAEGTGIGLFLVKGLVEHMGGSIALESREGKGATFILTLKKGFSHFSKRHSIKHDVLVGDEISSTKRIEVPMAKSLIVEGEGKETILVVEDNYDFRAYLNSILSNKYTVLLAPEGKEAINVLKEQKPDLIISDVMMPGMNGLEFVNTVRSKEELQHMPVILLSAKNEDMDKEAGLSTGADIYLTKPIRSNMLLAQIAAVLRREKILKTYEEQPLSSVDEPPLIWQVREIVYRQLANSSLSVNMLADALFISREKLYREWKKVSEISVNDFIKQVRLDEAKVLLKEKGFNVQEAARAVGYKDANYFSTSFKKYFGYSPSEVKN